MKASEARTLAESWVTHLEAERKSPHTILTYTAGLNAYIRWCEREGLAVDLAPKPVEKFMAGLFEGGAEAATVLSRQRGVRRFSAWLADETGKPDKLERMKPPKLDEKIPPFVDEGQMAALLATCKTRSFNDVRDRAIISLMADTMTRATEVLDLKRDDVNIRQRTAVIERGKGGKGRVTAFSAGTARDLDRYIRARAPRRLGRRTVAVAPGEALPRAAADLRRALHRAAPAGTARRSSVPSAPSHAPVYRRHRVPAQGRPGHVADGPRRVVGHRDGSALHPGG